MAGSEYRDPRYTKLLVRIMVTNDLVSHYIQHTRHLPSLEHRQICLSPTCNRAEKPQRDLADLNGPKSLQLSKTIGLHIATISRGRGH